MEHRASIMKMHQEGYSQRAIAKSLSLPPSVIRYWILREGRSSKQGRPRITDKETDWDLCYALYNNPFITVDELQKTIAPQCSTQTIRLRFKQAGIPYKIATPKPALNKTGKLQRFQFAIRHANTSIAQWHRVVFTSVKLFMPSSEGTIRVCRPARGKVTRPEAFCAWMAFGGKGRIRVLHPIPRKAFNASYYKTALIPLIKDVLLEERLILMQDLSFIHLTPKDIPVMNWPLKSPDLNPAEDVWDAIARGISENTTLSLFMETLIESFYNLPSDHLTHLVESMPQRIANVFHEKGEFSEKKNIQQRIIFIYIPLNRILHHPSSFLFIPLYSTACSFRHFFSTGPYSTFVRVTTGHTWPMRTTLIF